MIKDLPIRNIFLPAALVGASLFSGLTFALPALVRQQAPDQFQGGLTFSGPSRIALDRIHKELAITYIGTTIVLSAGAGLGTAEVLRKRHEKQAKQPSLKSVLSEYVDHYAQQKTSEMDPQFSDLWSDFSVDAASENESEMTQAVEVDYTFPEPVSKMAWPVSFAKTAIADVQSSSETDDQSTDGSSAIFSRSAPASS